MTKDKFFWLATRDGIPCGSFETRREAVKWFKDILKQVLEDFKFQDKVDEYDYNIEFKKIEIKSYETRETYLGS